MEKKPLLICGALGFIGRNLLEHFSRKAEYEVYATYHKRIPPAELVDSGNIIFVEADLTNAADVERVIRGKRIVIQAAATTSGAKDIVTKPYLHVTDNAVMNSLLFRACHEHKVEHVVFFSCTTMYPSGQTPVKEEDFDGTIVDKYFGVGWTKVYIEKMCEFYARLGTSRYTALRHSNIYGPHDKFDLEKSHVFGATVAKVMQAQGGKLTVWGDGSDERDLLYVEDLVHFVDLILTQQKKPYELLNLGLGRSVSVKELVEKVIRGSGKKVDIEYDLTKPSIGFKLAVNIDRAKAYGWKPEVSLEEGIRKTLEWYLKNGLSEVSS